MYINKLDDIVHKYNNTDRSTIKLKLAEVNSDTYIDFDKKNNKEDPKFQVGDHVRISKYKNTFPKSYLRNWSEEDFVILKVKNIVPCTYVINYLTSKEIVRMFYDKELQMHNAKNN